MRTAMPYRGGKQQLAQWIASILPAGHIYVEACAGMASVLLARPKAPVEILNDRDERIIDWWRIVQQPDQCAKLTARLRRTPLAHGSLDDAQRILTADRTATTMLDRAWAVTVKLGQSYGSMLHKSPQLMRQDPLHRPGTSMPDTWAAKPDLIDRLVDRIQRVSLECREATAIIDRYRIAADTVLYIDPPYAPEHGPIYKHQVNFNAITELVADAPASIAISGYPTCGWDDLLPDWQRLDQARNSRLAHTDETECLWINFEPRQATLL